jgi:Mg2+-importing ATPase
MSLLPSAVSRPSSSCQEVIVKHLPAIQNFGSIDILCSDKTGTLTAGVMQFDRSLDPTGAASPRPLTLAYINGRFETGIRSPLDAANLHQPAVDMSGYQKIDEIPFDFERRRLSVVVEAPDGAGRSLPRVRPNRSSPCPRRSKPEAASRRSARQ